MTDHARLEVPFDVVAKWEEIEGSCARFFAAAEWGHKQALATPPPEPPTVMEALAARPLLERVARMGDCIGANTVGEIMAISGRAAAWLEANPPGQPVAIEPRGCPTPGACSCVEPATTPLEPPTDEELWAIWNNHDGPIPAILRAALKRWGHR